METNKFFTFRILFFALTLGVFVGYIVYNALMLWSNNQLDSFDFSFIKLGLLIGIGVGLSISVLNLIFGFLKLKR
jgi:hypothetical protein